MFICWRKIGIAFLVCLLAGISIFAQKSNGFFRVEQRDGVWWFITPEGKPFFSNGVNVVSKGASRENYSENNPQYAAFRFYPTSDAWADDTLERLREWNFNTIGSWSNDDLYKRGAMPYTKVLHLGGDLVPWRSDLFGAEIAATIDENARREIGNLKDDKNLIGYFSDNELGWWDDSVFQHFLAEPAENKTRRMLIQILRGHYKNNFAKLKNDFETGKARNLADLERDAGNITLKPNGRGAEVIDEFMFQLTRQYYKLVHDAIRRYDPNHLILGDRYPSWYSQSVVRAAIPYVDVVSTNYMADWTDGNISHFYLDTLYKLTKKPVIVTEYYMSAADNRSGNKNSSAAFPVVKTQKERAASFKTNLTALAELPYVVGAHWFQFTDEPTNGRGDGEDYNFGLVDIHNEPYKDLTVAAKDLNPAVIHAQSNRKNVEQNNVEIEIPPAVSNAENGLLEWNREKSFVESNSKQSANLPFADFYASWNKKNLYLAIYAADFAEAKFYAGSKIPESERMTWTLDFDAKKEPLKARFGDGASAEINDKNIEYKSFNASTRFTLIVKLPAAYFGKKEFQNGDSLNLQSTLFSHSRAEKMSWTRTLKLEKTVSE